MKRLVVASIASALALTACSSETDATNTEAKATSVPSEGADPVASEMQDVSNPQSFVDMAVSSDMYEVEAGKLAQQAGASAAVKSFGAMMVKDHTASTAKLKTAVEEVGGGLSLPSTMQAKHQQMLEQLRTAGADFDGVYAQQQLKAHEDALALMKAQAANGTAAPLKAHATAAVPVIEGHLSQVRDLR